MQVENSCVSMVDIAQPARSSSFGLELVGLLTEQLSGSLLMESTPNFSVSVTFPVSASNGHDNRGSIG